MNESDVRRLLQDALDVVAPGAEVGTVPSDVDLRRALDLDSLDFLNLIVEIDNRMGIHTAEVDYPRLTTVATAAAYLPERARA
ncbi:MAG TPA: acyl carrier protein [Sporichthya sp.]|nr:acyl carrier protein [Sporichthya sp.]